MTIVKYDVVDSFQVRLKMFAKLHPSKREAESIDIKGDIAIFHTILIWGKQYHGSPRSYKK